MKTAEANYTEIGRQTNNAVNFMQMRDLTDEELLQLPKEEILQLYKNCYKLLVEYANARLQELSLTDMAEEYIKKELPNAEKPFHYDAEGAVCIRDFVKWARNKLTGK